MRMLVAFLWIALFLDSLEGFSQPWTNRPGRTILPSFLTSLFSSSINATESSSPPSTDSGTNLTVTLPSFHKDNEGYPSPLHNIHVRTIMSEKECQIAYELAKQYAKSTGRWLQRDSERHQSYATCDFPVDDCNDLQTYLEDIGFDGRLFEMLSELYTVDIEDLSYLDLFVAHYKAKEGNNDVHIMDRLEAHRDGSLLSFSLLLNPPAEFEGGGTFYDALSEVEANGILHADGIIRPEKAGDAVLHSGKIFHGADVVTSGSRTVLVGFVDVAERCQRPGMLGEACKEWGRMDVVNYRFKRQESKGHKGWTFNNQRYLPGKSSCSVFKKGYVPAFQSLIRRAKPEFSKRKRLEAEDILLRNILLIRDERGSSAGPWINDGDITILD